MEETEKIYWPNFQLQQNCWYENLKTGFQENPLRNLATRFRLSAKQSKIHIHYSYTITQRSYGYQSVTVLR
jgi:hypothetical protein